MICAIMNKSEDKCGEMIVRYVFFLSNVDILHVNTKVIMLLELQTNFISTQEKELKEVVIAEQVQCFDSFIVMQSWVR